MLNIVERSQLVVIGKGHSSRKVAEAVIGE